ncbi:MAG: hypothetical protein AAGD09_03155 [Cyanobacteria bacterium P01_F01_bin.56]
MNPTLEQIGNVTVNELIKWLQFEQARAQKCGRQNHDPTTEISLNLYRDHIRLMQQDILGAAKRLIVMREANSTSKDRDLEAVDAEFEDELHA